MLSVDDVKAKISDTLYLTFGYVQYVMGWLFMVFLPVKQLICNTMHMPSNLFLRSKLFGAIASGDFFLQDSRATTQYTATFQTDRYMKLERVDSVGDWNMSLCLFSSYVPLLLPTGGFESVYNFRFVVKGGVCSVGVTFTPNDLIPNTNIGGILFNPLSGKLTAYLSDTGDSQIIEHDVLYSQSGISGYSTSQVNTIDLALYLSFDTIMTLRIVLSINKTLIDVSPRLALDWVDPSVQLVPTIGSDITNVTETLLDVEQISVSR